MSATLALATTTIPATASDRRTSPRKTPHATFPVALKAIGASSSRRLSAVLTDVSTHGLCLSLRSPQGLCPGDTVELLTLHGAVTLQVAWASPAGAASCGLSCSDTRVDLARMLSFFCD